MNKQPERIAIIVPAYNEARVIKRVLSGLPKTLKAGGKSYRFKIIVVNDGSNDRTAKIAQGIRGITLINHIINSGPGAATRTGLNYARDHSFAFAITMDADGQHDHKDVIRLAKTITKRQADLVIGSRLINTRGMPWYRIAGNRFLSLLTFVMFGLLVTDSQSGLKAFNTRALREIKYHSNSFAFCSEILWRSKQARLRVTEIPIRAVYTNYSLSKGQHNTDAIHIVRQLAKQRLMDLIS